MEIWIPSRRTPGKPINPEPNGERKERKGDDQIGDLGIVGRVQDADPAPVETCFDVVEAPEGQGGSRRGGEIDRGRAQENPGRICVAGIEVGAKAIGSTV